MRDQQIKEVESHKHLGVILSNDCTWQEHIDYIKEKAWTRINIMRRLKYDLDRKSLETNYKSFIRPLLEFSDVIWDNCTQQNKNELELIQLEAARISTGTTKLVSVANLYIETGWETLDARRNKHKLVFFYKMFNDLTPLYLSSLVPHLVQNGKSQVIWVSIGNKQLDPPPPWKRLDPTGKCWIPSGTLKNDRFLRN